MSTRSRRWLARCAVALLGVLLPLAALEIGLRLTRKPHAPPSPPMAVLCDGCPWLFEPNPARPDVSPQKLRDRVFSPVPEPGTRRILVLGDSLAYGAFAPRDNAFPKVLERQLGGEAAHVEVVNGGVFAYSPYNERQLYEHELRDLHAQIVVVSFCMNDVVDPSLHWAQLVGAGLPLFDLPPDAIPNPDYHRDHALPLLRRRLAARGSRLERLLARSELYRRAVAPLLAPGEPGTHVVANGKRYRSYLSGEDTLGMDVLVDYASPEWAWLRREYDALIADVRKDGAEVVILVNPVEYQLEDGFPLSPEQLFARYCEERKVRCFDVLPALREHGGTKLFFGKLNGVVDVWHYTSEGHAVVGAALADYLRREGLVP